MDSGSLYLAKVYSVNPKACASANGQFKLRSVINDLDLEVKILTSKLDELERSDFGVEMFSDFRNRYQIPVAAGLILILLSTITPAYKPAGITTK